MKIEDIKVEKVYRITGRFGGCFDCKCIDCDSYKEHKIIAMKIEDEDYDKNGRIVKGKNILTNENCHFNPKDLEPENKTMKELLE